MDSSHVLIRWRHVAIFKISRKTSGHDTKYIYIYIYKIHELATQPMRFIVGPHVVCFWVHLRGTRQSPDHTSTPTCAKAGGDHPLKVLRVSCMWWRGRCLFLLLLLLLLQRHFFLWLFYFFVSIFRERERNAVRN